MGIMLRFGPEIGALICGGLTLLASYLFPC